MAVGVREVADLVDHQQIGCAIATQSQAQGRVAVEAGQIAQQLAGGGKQHVMALEDGLVRDILRDHGLAHAAWAHQDGVGRRGEELERHQLGNRALIALLWPGPVVVGQSLEAPNVRTAQATLKRAASPFGLLPAQQGFKPGLLGTVAPVRKHPVQLQCRGALTRISAAHHRSPSGGRRRSGCGDAPVHHAA